MNCITPYLLEVDFPYHSNIIGYRDDMIDQYYSNIEAQKLRGLYNVIYENENLRNNIEKVFLETIHKIFVISPNINKINMHMYISTKENFSYIWHNHVNSATISSTFYLEMNKKGGGLEFGDFGDEGNTILYPKKNKLYLFPSWLYHRPLPPKDDRIRICINMDYYSESRAQCRDVFLQLPDGKINCVW